MNRPEYSLTLDSVICSRCNTISRAEEDTCPNCGADRQGAIFTSKAEAASHARAAAIEPEGDELDDVVDLRDTGWLTRMARRRMVTSYPSLVEPGDELLSGPARKPARKGLAMLVGSVVAGLAAGGYLYTQYDFGGASVKDTTTAAAGAIRDKSASVNDADTTRREELTRARPEPSTTTPPIAAAPKAEAPRVIVAETKPAVAAPKQAAPTVATAETHASKPQPAPHVVVAETKAPAGLPKQAAPTVAMAETRPSTPAKSNPTPAATIASAPPKPTVVAAAKTPEPIVAVTPPVQAASHNPATVAASITPQPPAKVAVATPPAAPTPKTTLAAAPHVVAPVTQPAAQTAANAASKAPVATRSTTALAATPTHQPEAQQARPTTLAAATPPKPQKVAETQPETPNPAVARTIAAVQQSLASRDLSSARRHMRTLRANESRSPEIQQLAAELSRQERARDSALSTARTCTMNKEPSCAIRNARRAVALEPRNPQSQIALRQAMAVQTEANTEYFRQASAIPQPMTPAMTFDGRWSVSHRHTASSDSDRANYTLFGLGVPTVMKGRGDAH